MTAWHSTSIAANGMQIHYTRTGGDKPPIVLAHGFSDDGLCWTPVAEELSKRYDLIMIDARGHGRSAAPERDYSPLTMAEDLAGVITALQLQKPAILGHSMGGAMTYLLAGLHPDLPGAILIEDSGLRNLSATLTDESAARQQQMRANLMALKSKSREELIAQGRLNSPSWSEAELGPWADAKLRFNLHALQRIGAVVENWAEIVGRISCPALLMRADVEKGSIVPAEDAAQLQSLIPQLQVVHIAGAGHNIRREQFDVFISTVERFLAEHWQPN